MEGTLFEESSGPQDDRVVVGIDFSLTKTGVSVLSADAQRHTTGLFAPKFKGQRRLGEIWDFFSEFVRALEANFFVEEYVLEQYAFAAKNSHQASIGEGGGALKLALVQQYGYEERVAYPSLASPNAVKKFATGKGSGDKNLIMMRAYQKWGVDLPDDNMVDAYVLARIAHALTSGRTDHAYENEVVEAIERNPGWRLSE